MKALLVLVVAALVIPSVPVLAQEVEPKQETHWLFNPTPRDQMRELSADRPDKTESPHSVPAGHFQIESSFFSYTYDKRNPDYNGDSVHGFAVMQTILKMGITDFMDFQVGLEPYVHNLNYNFATGTSQATTGFGDVVLRAKFGVVGNDSGRFALGILPFVSIPTKRNDSIGDDHVGVSVAFPWSLELEKGWGLGGQTQFDYTYGVNNTKYYPAFVNTFELTYEISERFGAYVELYAYVSSENNLPWEGTVDTGLTFAATDNLQLDAGINMGVTRQGDDWNPFVGFTWRH
ncbi:MAG: hypothetical protein COV45_01910 [Deltaproteobacteria bacterium CG11_big_fil_rev_8_21_14_0_20_47_16]|nr:MAG: hypothetical protein COV45_01910 [Deltaproteobacteria bacterium CG11_big_fil_rev_8_21_14_0_20_47_16]